MTICAIRKKKNDRINHDDNYFGMQKYQPSFFASYNFREKLIYTLVVEDKKNEKEKEKVFRNRGIRFEK